MAYELSSTPSAVMRHRLDAVAVTASVRATSRHRRDRALSDTPQRPDVARSMASGLAATPSTRCWRPVHTPSRKTQVGRRSSDAENPRLHVHVLENISSGSHIPLALLERGQHPRELRPLGLAVPVEINQ
jgi:hypothetical protein